MNPHLAAIYFQLYSEYSELNKKASNDQITQEQRFSTILKKLLLTKMSYYSPHGGARNDQKKQGENLVGQLKRLMSSNETSSESQLITFLNFSKKVLRVIEREKKESTLCTVFAHDQQDMEVLTSRHNGHSDHDRAVGKDKQSNQLNRGLRLLTVDPDGEVTAYEPSSSERADDKLFQYCQEVVSGSKAKHPTSDEEDTSNKLTTIKHFCGYSEEFNLFNTYFACAVHILQMGVDGVQERGCLQDGKLIAMPTMSEDGMQTVKQIMDSIRTEVIYDRDKKQLIRKTFVRFMICDNEFAGETKVRHPEAALEAQNIVSIETTIDLTTSKLQQSRNIVVSCDLPFKEPLRGILKTVLGSEKFWQAVLSKENTYESQCTHMNSIYKEIKRLLDSECAGVGEVPIVAEENNKNSQLVVKPNVPSLASPLSRYYAKWKEEISTVTEQIPDLSQLTPLLSVYAKYWDLLLYNERKELLNKVNTLMKDVMTSGRYSKETLRLFKELSLAIDLETGYQDRSISKFSVTKLDCYLHQQRQEYQKGNVAEQAKHPTRQVRNELQRAGIIDMLQEFSDPNFEQTERNNYQDRVITALTDLRYRIAHWNTNGYKEQDLKQASLAIIDQFLELTCEDRDGLRVRRATPKVDYKDFHRLVDLLQTIGKKASLTELATILADSDLPEKYEQALSESAWRFSASFNKEEVKQKRIPLPLMQRIGRRITRNSKSLLQKLIGQDADKLKSNCFKDALSAAVSEQDFDLSNYPIVDSDKHAASLILLLGSQVSEQGDYYEELEGCLQKAEYQKALSDFDVTAEYVKTVYEDKVYENKIDEGESLSTKRKHAIDLSAVTQTLDETQADDSCHLGAMRMPTSDNALPKPGPTPRMRGGLFDEFGGNKTAKVVPPAVENSSSLPVGFAVK